MAVPISSTGTANCPPSCNDNPVSCSITVIPKTPDGQDFNTIYQGYGSDCLKLSGIAHGRSCPLYVPMEWWINIADAIITVCPTATTTYTLTVTDSRGCTSVCTITIKVVDVRCGNNGVIICYKNHDTCVSKNDVLKFMEAWSYM